MQRCVQGRQGCAGGGDKSAQNHADRGHPLGRGPGPEVLREDVGFWPQLGRLRPQTSDLRRPAVAPTGWYLWSSLHYVARETRHPVTTTPTTGLPTPTTPGSEALVGPFCQSHMHAGFSILSGGAAGREGITSGSEGHPPMSLGTERWAARSREDLDG